MFLLLMLLVYAYISLEAMGTVNARVSYQLESGV